MTLAALYVNILFEIIIQPVHVFTRCYLRAIQIYWFPTLFLLLPRLLHCLNPLTQQGSPTLSFRAASQCLCAVHGVCVVISLWNTYEFSFI